MASALLVPAAVVGLTRVFELPGSIFPIIAASLMSSAVAVMLRRLGLSLLIATPISLMILAVIIMNQFVGETIRLGVLPTSATKDAAAALGNELIVNFQELKPPVPALDPFIAMSMTAAWILAFLTDWGALRLRLAFEPVLPAALLFVFAAALGTGDNQVLTSTVLGGAVALWAVTQRTMSVAATTAWLGNDAARGTASIAKTGAVLAMFAVLVGTVLGPRLPGASADELVSFRDSGDPTRVVVSPFVNIESRLVDQADTVLFTVAADEASYWRLAGLDTYDSNIWKVSGNFSTQNGELPQTEYAGVHKDNQQDFSIRALNAIWLPAAYSPSRIIEASDELTWNSESGSLTVSKKIPTSDGIGYSLLSSVSIFTAADLANTSEFVPPEIAERYLALPQLPPIVAEEAQRITAGVTSRYDKMLALQNYFQGFEYNTQLSPRVGDPIEQFLNERVGFCQQFSGTFALMARSLGIPSRVAIGFTWGDPIGLDEQSGRTVYQVTGRQTHAWPEVWFEGLGWVAFEPTPGRGSPTALDYSELPARQDSLVQPNDPDSPITTTIPDPLDPTPNSVNPDRFEDAPPGGQAPPLEKPAAPSNVGRNFKIILGLLLLCLIVCATPIYRAVHRRLRRDRVTTPAEKAGVVWTETLEDLELGFDLQRYDSETRTEFAARVGRDRRIPTGEIQRLAQIATVARYFPAGVSETESNAADQAGESLSEAVKAHVPRFAMVRRQLDPRILYRSLWKTPGHRAGLDTPTTALSSDLATSPELLDLELVGPPVAPPASTNGSAPH